MGGRRPSQRGVKLWYRNIMEEDEEEAVGMLDKVLELEDEEPGDCELDLDSPLNSGEIGPLLLRSFQVREERDSERQREKESKKLLLLK